MGADDERGQRLAALLALEIDRLMYDLTHRKAYMLGLWARLRSRDVFQETMFSRWRTVTAGDLALLDTSAVAALEAFHGALDDLRTLLRYTEAMPITLEETYDTRLEDLTVLAEEAVRTLGGVPPHPARPPALSLKDAPPAPQGSGRGDPSA